MVQGRRHLFVKITDNVTEKVGWAVSLLVLPIFFIFVVEVVARYVFNISTVWAWPINKQLFAVFSLFGGAYALLHGRHIRVEVLYERFGSRLKLASSVLAGICFLFFIGLLVWQGYLMAEISIKGKEAIPGVFPLPLYPLKTLIPVAALLLLLQGMASFLAGRDISKPFSMTK